MTRGLRNNNPGNIRISGIKYQGEIQPSKDKNFKQFSSMPYGYRAMFVILRTYYVKYGLKSISQMIRRWAPANENNTVAYINHVSAWSGIHKDTSLEITSKGMMCAVVAAMSRVENGIKANSTDVQKGWDLL
jgi:hypothetical protein